MGRWTSAGIWTSNAPSSKRWQARSHCADDVAVTQRVLGGIPVIDIEIAAVHTTDVILYFHGGGYALGSASASVGLASDLSRRAKTRAISAACQSRAHG